MVRGVRVHYHTKMPFEKNTVHTVISLLKKELSFSVESLEISFITDAAIHDVNKKFLQHDFPTDIITFDYTVTSGVLHGELIIAPGVAKENARKFNVPYTEELIRLVIHGILHLLQFDDKTAPEKKRMFALQEALIKKFILRLK